MAIQVKNNVAKAATQQAYKKEGGLAIFILWSLVIRLQCDAVDGEPINPHPKYLHQIVTDVSFRNVLQDRANDASF